MKTQIINNEEHYSKVLTKVSQVKHSLWIATADIKDLYVKSSSGIVPFLSVLSGLVRRKVIIRLLYAKKPGVNFIRDFQKYSNLKYGIEQILCPRIHCKIIIFDMETAYIGSANLTGAGIGMKGKYTRNFETGILTSESVLVNSAIEQVDDIWRGVHCPKCKRKQYCPQPII